MKETIKNKNEKISIIKTFIPWSFFGIILLIVALYLDAKYPNSNRSILCTVLINALSSFGISMIIAVIFSYITTTIDFIDMTKKFLSEIIIERKFLVTLADQHKREAIKALIWNDNIEKNSNLHSYYDYLINELITTSKNSIRENYTINCTAYFDNDRIAVKGSYKYRVFRTHDKFEPIKIKFLDGNLDENSSIPSKLEKLIIDSKDLRKEIIIGDSELSKSSINHNNNEYTLPLNELDISKGQHNLNITLEVIEYGKQKSMLFTFMALQDTDGFSLILDCHDNISIQDTCIFTVNATCHEKISEDRKNIKIDCSQWLSKGSGFSILLVKND